LRFERKNKYTMDDLLQIMTILRSPEGCPWDREQTHKTIRNNLIEETYEAVEAIDKEDSELLEEELGDVLLQVVFHSQLEKENGNFDFSDVVDGVAKKMIERHPHVFGNVTVQNSSEVLKNWDAIKRRTKGRKTVSQVLEGVSPALPALMRSQKIGKKILQADGKTPDKAVSLSELEEAVQNVSQLPETAEESEKMQTIGKLLFSAVSLSEALGVEAEQTLAQYCDSIVASHQKADK
jgi:tetrapyrrole methylase family protein / MazG family protein